MLNVSTLKNLHLKDFFDFFIANSVDFKKRITSKTTLEKYEDVLTLLKEGLANDPDGGFNRSLDSLLYSHLFYTSNNYHMVYRLDSCVFTSETHISRVIEFFAAKPELGLAKFLTDETEAKEFEIQTIRLESVNDHLKSINLLVKISQVRTQFLLDTDVYVGISIDVVNRLVVFKFKLNFYEILRGRIPSLLSQLKSLVRGQDTSHKSLSDLGVNISSLNEKNARFTIFKMFKELSVEAENIIDGNTPPETDDKIQKFVEEAGISNVTKKQLEDYKKQIKAVIYQEISSALSESNFKEGWVFRFSFKEGSTTRASSRTEDYGPVYSSKVYWHLKELVFKEKEMYEAGFRYSLGEVDGKKDYILVKIESKNECLSLQYYYSQRYKRGEKDDFVLRKINEHLSE